MSKMVHQGQDGWLFLTGGSNFVIHLYQRDSGHLPDRALEAWRDAIIDRKRRCDQLGIAYAHMVVPEKITIYGHKLSSPIVDPDLAPSIRLATALQIDPAAPDYLDLVQPMRARRDEVDLYWRTDTHWTPAGFRLAHDVLCDRLGLKKPSDLEDHCVAEGGRLMDLGVKLDPPAWEHVRVVSWLKHASRVYENEVARLLETPVYGGAIHVGSRAIFKNSRAPNKHRLMLVGDSFSSVGANALTAMLAETFEHVDFIWATNVDWRIVRREKPDFLITQMAERYMALPPRREFNLRNEEIRQLFVARRRRLAAWWREKQTRFQRMSRSP
jgi:alginate O-acetyltransferase complex protein AlgJ